MVHTIIIGEITYEFEDYTQYLNFIANRYGFKTWEEYKLEQEKNEEQTI
jgi:hypothetical protein